MTVKLYRLDSLPSRKAVYIHCKTKEEDLDKIEMEWEDMIVVKNIFSKHIFIVINGQHRTISIEDAHNIYICGSRDDAWVEDAIIED